MKYKREANSITAWMFCAKCHATLGQYYYLHNGLPYCSQSCVDEVISEQNIQDKLESIVDKYEES